MSDETAANEASDRIEAAINHYLQVTGASDNTEFLDDWVVLACLQDPEIPSNAPFIMIQPRNELPPHRVLGLVALAQSIIMEYDGP